MRHRPATWAAAVRDAPTASVLLGIVALLCMIGVVMVGSASSVISMELYGSPFSLLLRELLWMALGLVVLLVAMRIDYRRLRRLRVLLVVVTLGLLCAVLVPGVGEASGGSSRWLGLGELRVQPSELMKLALAIFGAELLARRAQRHLRARATVVPMVLVTVAACGLILLQPDMGTALVLASITLALLFASGVPVRLMARILGAIGGLALVVGMMDPYRRARLLSFLHPSAHQSGSGYQVLQSLIGLGTGHLVGLGLGAGRQKWGVLPNAHTDFIFSVIGEELGLVGAVAVLVLLGALAWFGLRAASRAPDRFGSLLAVALVAWIASEALINVGAVLGLLPVTGIPLPFISFGGSSLVITMAAAGILANIAHHEVHRAGPPAQLITLAPTAGVDRRPQRATTLDTTTATTSARTIRPVR